MSSVLVEKVQIWELVADLLVYGRDLSSKPESAGIVCRRRTDGLELLQIRFLLTEINIVEFQNLGGYNITLLSITKYN